MLFLLSFILDCLYYFFNHDIDVVGEVVACQKIVNLSDEKGKTKKRMQLEIQDLKSEFFYYYNRLMVILI